ncbi:MAG: hypothetical protein JSS66_09250 [Armatimonadetes bacterium]|nr:hypothetical protein [Armatimonadota bacterium]
MPNNELTWVQAIEKVIRDRGEPMHYMDVTEAIVTQGLRESLGATPSYTVAAQFSQDLKLGDRARFARFSTGVYGLREWLGENPTVAVQSQPQDLPARQSGLAIQAFGMYWDRKRVDWSRTTPRILGQQFQTTSLVDFCEQRGIYVLYDHLRIVYVGRATQQSVGGRLRDHTLDRLRSRWDRFSWFGFWQVTTEGGLVPNWSGQDGLEQVVSLLEAVLIELAEPPQNRQQGKGLTAMEYLQAEDPGLKQKEKAQFLAELASKWAD